MMRTYLADVEGGILDQWQEDHPLIGIFLEVIQWTSIAVLIFVIYQILTKPRLRRSLMNLLSLQGKTRVNIALILAGAFGITLLGFAVMILL